MRTLRELLVAPKVLLLPPRPRVKAHPSHAEFDVPIACELPGSFSLAVRVNVTLSESFTLALLYEFPGARRVPILRVNGDHGGHTNPDGTRIVSGPHIHAPPDAFLDRLADGLRHDEYAVEISSDVRSPSLAWPIFRERANVVEDARIYRYLTRIRDSATGEQLDMFDEE